MKFIEKTLCLFIFTLAACHSNDVHDYKKTCIQMEVMRNKQFVVIDSCFTAPTRDSLDRLLAYVKKGQEEFQDYSSKLLFVIVDTLQKKPEDYQYALVQSDAGIINSDVVLTTDPLIVKEKTGKFSKGNIIFKKVVIGENLRGLVETIFKTNVRINYRTESNVRVTK
jgi:hypothetical protein